MGYQTQEVTYQFFKKSFHKQVEGPSKFSQHGEMSEKRRKVPITITVHNFVWTLESIPNIMVLQVQHITFTRKLKQTVSRSPVQSIKNNYDEELRQQRRHWWPEHGT